MDSQSRTLVHQQDVFVFIDDVQLGSGHSQVGIVLPGFVEKFVVDVKLQHIACVQTGVPVDALAVAFDPFQADVFLGQGGRQQGNSLCQKPVQSLPRIIGADFKLFHIGYLF